MSMLEGDPTYVRASVARQCNLDCVYCPKPEGMENRVPATLSGKALDNSSYSECLRHISRQGISGVSFTGGEPTLNPSLPCLASRAREYFARVELTSNGLRLQEMLPELRDSLDVIKISLDTTDAEDFIATTRGQRSSLELAKGAIETAADAGIRVGINFVAMKSTFPQLPDIVNFAQQVNSRCGRKTVYVSVLDFYYSPSRRTFWECEFIPTTCIEKRLERLYGKPKRHNRFGCRFAWFDTNTVDIRLKDSFNATHRAAKCNGCPYYCQEGIYGLKLSVEGWVTTCPTNDAHYGIRLTSNLDDAEADTLLAPLVADIASAKPDPCSFEKLLQTHSLHPKSISRS